MRGSQYRNVFALLGCCFFVGVMNVAAREVNKVLTCEDNGKVYNIGETFPSTENPKLICECEHVVHYFGETSGARCYPAVNECIPITKNIESPEHTPYTNQQICTDDRALIPASDTQNLEHTKEESICSFGEFKLGIRDYFLHHMINDPRNCVKCTCEEPPKPTCVRPRMCPMLIIE